MVSIFGPQRKVLVRGRPGCFRPPDAAGRKPGKGEWHRPEQMTIHSIVPAMCCQLIEAQHEGTWISLPDRPGWIYPWPIASPSHDAFPEGEIEMGEFDANIADHFPTHPISLGQAIPCVINTQFPMLQGLSEMRSN